MIALLVSGAMAIVVSFFGTPLVIRFVQARRLGQPIHEDLPQGHIEKSGKPTMGGLAIVAGATAGYVAGHIATDQIFTWGAIAVVVAIVGGGVVGLADDYLKVTRQHSDGLSRRLKSLGQLVVAGGFCFIAIRYAHVRTNLSFTRWDSLFPLPALPTWLWIVFAVLVVYLICNGVNFADGEDGLAAGSATFTLSFFAIAGFWQFRHPDIYDVPQALDLALVAIALTGACVGFLWWNAAPSQIIMGDTGSLGIGAGVAGLALMMNLHLLLPVAAGLFVLETLSVGIQIASFQLLGKRVFRMAPLHHHFELKGWPETTVTVRFWILAGLFTALALGLFYADFIAVGGVD